MAVVAVQQVGRMRGGAQSHLMRCADDNLYVVKFQNNPQHLRVLANELLASRLAEAAGLTVPDCDVVEVSPWLVENDSNLVMELPHSEESCRPGLQFGSRYVGGLMPGLVVDILDDEPLLAVRNLGEFAGILAFDKWTCNADARQAVFSRKMRERRYKATFIDHGYCFNAGEWRFSDAPLRGVFGRNCVYREITGWRDFEPWLGRIETMPPEKIWSIAETVPPEWYGGEVSKLEELTEQLIRRRGLVRELIDEFRDTKRAPFPKWMGRGRSGAQSESFGMGWVQNEGSKLVH